MYGNGYVDPFFHRERSEVSNPDAFLDHAVGHTLNLFHCADRRATAGQLLSFLRTIPLRIQPGNDDENTLFNEVWKGAYYYQQKLEEEYLLPKYGVKKLNEGLDKLDENAINDYMLDITLNLPGVLVLRHTQAFFLQQYLSDDYAVLRAVIALAFSGLLFSALTDPDFSSLCKDKSIDVSGMSIEERMDVLLDHEALYSFLLEKLGVEGAA